ncbi:MOSC domain-containing protein [Yeosuana sp. AK3]
MKIISTNLATSITIVWNGKEETTGIYKNPTNKPIFIGKADVKHDEVTDRIHHGGFYKACYMFSAEQYPYWKNLYPNLNWNWGMFGENLTVSGFDETQVYLGDIYKVGEALVQISQYREPCYKLGIKFGTQMVLKQFIEHGFGGTYLSILEEGYVNVHDEFKLIERPKNRISVADLFRLIHSKDKDQNLLKIVANSEAIPPKKQALLRSYIID